MSDEVFKVIEKWQSDERLTALDEARIKQAIILPTLRGLGWDMDNTDELWPEYALEGGRVDYALLIGNTPQVFIEAKNGSERLEEHQEQLLRYAFKHGVKIAILTNGARWWFYLPLQEGNWKQRQFDTVELDKQPTGEITQKFVDFLGKENVSSAKAVQNAEALYKAHRISATLPGAWNQLVSEPHDWIVELLVEKTKELCKHEPDEDEVKRFLSTHLQKIKIAQSPVAVEPSPTSETKPRNRRKRKAFTVTKPEAFTFESGRYEVLSWKEMILKLCEILYANHANRFEQQVLGIRGSKGRRLFSRNADLNQGWKINGTGIYVDTCYSAEGAKRFAERVITEFGYDKSSLSFEVRQ